MTECLINHVLKVAEGTALETAINPGASWDVYFLLPDGEADYGFWLAWHMNCLIPDQPQPAMETDQLIKRILKRAKHR